ncbi:hypothetical protein ACFWJS_11365 [Streptomyces sp. NPDC127061]|uniref:hypothetical protein n=1 Tax=unclassified Streptomyces TaxID=2593676 RepID=UPI003642EE31
MRRQASVPVTTAALAAGPVAPQHVYPALIDYFRQQLEGHYRADMLLGPHDLIGTVSAQYQLIDKLLRSAKGEASRGLLRVGAAFWHGVTQEIAVWSRDPHLVGYSLVNQAQVRTDLGDGHAVVDLCEAVLDDADHLVPKVRIMAMQRQAYCASLTGERGLVDQLIDRADRLLPRVDGDPPWGNACRRTPGYLEVQRATCYGRLGLGAEAGALWSRVLATVRRPDAGTAGGAWPGRQQLRRRRGSTIKQWRLPGP